MAKVSYANLKLKVNKDIKTFNFMGQEIEVLQYLPIEDKYDLIMITLQKSEENGIYNSLKLDMFFQLHLVYMYTNLSITDRQKEYEPKLYDTLKSNGFFEEFYGALNEDEYNELYEYIQEIATKISSHRNNMISFLQTVIQDLPANMAAASEVINNFDKEKFKAVIDFANEANGNRTIFNQVADFVQEEA